MGYPLDPAAQNAALDALLSRDLSGIPTAFEVALYDAHPLLGGVELSAVGGYARALISLDLTDFPAASGGTKTSVEVVFADATAGWSDTAPFAVLIDAADSTTRWYAVRLTDEVNVTTAQPGPSVFLSIYFNTEA
jgi:hypothetical protein